jgi:hypothetical protein
MKLPHVKFLYFRGVTRVNENGTLIVEVSSIFENTTGSFLVTSNKNSTTTRNLVSELLFAIIEDGFKS